jgi:diguanylate cyclase (GGDEF)-like protein
MLITENCKTKSSLATASLCWILITISSSMAITVTLRAEKVNDAVQNLQQAVFKLNLPNLNSYCADRVSLSIGVAHFDECSSSVSLSESLQHADSALYHAKRGGRNQYAVSEVAKAEV